MQNNFEAPVCLLKCSITSEALLWILCSWKSNDIQAILAICWTRISRTHIVSKLLSMFPTMDRYCHLPQLQIHVFSLFSHLFHLEQILSHLPPKDNHSSTNKKRTNKQMNEEMIARVKTRKRSGHTCQPSCSAPPAPACSAQPGARRSRDPPCQRIRRRGNLALIP